MRPIHRIELIETIGRELQNRMTFQEINSYLPHHDVNCEKSTSGVNSKRVYVKELLADEPDDAILNIAEDLEIEHGFARPQNVNISESKFWQPVHFRLFLSHVASDKERASRLQVALRHYGISAFVAHEDIEPTEDWQDEIERALFSMDAMVAILSDDFHQSYWTDQEIGWALGRDALVIPLRVGTDPYGFLGKFQGFSGTEMTVSDVVDGIFGILSKNSKTRGELAKTLINLLLVENEEESAAHWLGLLNRFETIPLQYLENLSENAPDSDLVKSTEDLVTIINELLRAHEMAEITFEESIDIRADDLPF